MDIIESIQAQALLAVVRQDGDYLLRRIQRWFSTTYSTSLIEVEKLPTEYLLQHFFESSIENMDARAKAKLIAELTGVDEDKKSDEEFIKAAAKTAQAQAKKRKAKVKEATKKIEELSEKDFLSPQDVLSAVTKAGIPAPNLPDIKMDFSSNLDDDDVLKGL